MSAFDFIAAQDYQRIGSAPHPPANHEGQRPRPLFHRPSFDLDHVVNVHKELMRMGGTLAGRDTSILAECVIHGLAYVLETGNEHIRQLLGADARCVVQILQDWLELAPPTHQFRQRALCLLVKLSATSGELPRSLFVDDVHIRHLRDPIFRGGCADIFRGTLRGLLVAVKRPRATDVTSNPRARLCREALVWRQLKHPHVLPFVGIDAHTFRSTHHVAIVTPWRERGTLRNYMKSNAYRHSIDSYRLMTEVADGLEYLHGQKVVHGDINDVNILMTDDGHAQLSGLDHASVSEDAGADMTATSINAGSVAWMSPQRLMIPNHRRNMPDDVYAYGCLIYLLSTSHQIFPGLNLLAVMNTITHGERPPRPQALRATPFFDCIWRLIDSCWAQEEAKRPTMVQVLGQLHHAPHDGPIMRTTTVMSSDGLSTQPDEEGSQTVTGYVPSVHRATSDLLHHEHNDHSSRPGGATMQQPRRLETDFDHMFLSTAQGHRRRTEVSPSGRAHALHHAVSHLQSTFPSSDARHYESFDQELEISSQHYVTSTDVSVLGPWRGVSFDSLVDMHAEFLHASESSPTLATSIAGADTLHRLAVAFAVWSEQVIQLCGEQARRMVQILQDWLDSAPQAHRFRQGAICLLVKLAATSGELPGSLFKDGIRIENSRDPTFSGGCADIFRGTFEGQVVALKRPRVIDSETTSDPQARVFRELLVWRQLTHPFILPFIGVDRQTFSSTDHIAIVTPWRDRGTLRAYMKSEFYRQHADPFLLMTEVAQALVYLHEQRVVHGDINEVNILITDDGHPQLADFGLSIMSEGTEAHMTATLTDAGTSAWMSPQRIEGHQRRRSTADDVYAYGCLAYFLFAGHRIFHDIKTSHGVSLKITRGERPNRPSSLLPTESHDHVWRLIEACWAREEQDRPTMIHALSLLPEMTPMV